MRRCYSSLLIPILYRSHGARSGGAGVEWAGANHDLALGGGHSLLTSPARPLLCRIVFDAVFATDCVLRGWSREAAT